MKAVIAFLVLKSIFLVAVFGNEELKPKEHVISLDAGLVPFSFGALNRIKVSYKNNGAKPWVVHSPNKSLDVSLRFKPLGSTGRPGGYCLGVPIILETEVAIFDCAPDLKPISILPGESFSFKVKFRRGWTGDLKPGSWSVWLEDYKEKLNSNKLSIPLRFTKDSIAGCVRQATDVKLDVFQRRFYAKWLYEFMPDLDLNWPPSLQRPPRKHRLPKVISASDRKEMNNNIRKKLHAVEAFCADKENARVVEAAIERINKKGNFSTPAPEKTVDTHKD